MDGKGWKPHYGISQEGIELLGYVEALPREARREILEAVEKLCRSQGYLSLHDDLGSALALTEAEGDAAEAGNVIPLFTRRKQV